MLIVETIKALRDSVTSLQQRAESINFVPTMGNLHQGHIALVEEAKKLTGKTIVSIFVNPMQFNDQSDLAKYPRTMDADIDKLEAAGVDILFAPDIAEIYGPSGLDGQTKVMVPGLSEHLEGASRPGHFDGVSTVVAKLFNLVQPQNAFFGEKDFQQLAIIRKMVSNLNIPVNIISQATIREADGLAMSSRNGYLNPEERSVAPNLYKALQQIKEQIENSSDSFEDIQQQAMNWLDTRGLDSDYLFIADTDTLLQANRNTQNLVILGAAYLGKTRLIDNIPLS